MAKRLYQAFDEGAGGTAREAGEALRRAERRTRARARAAAETTPAPLEVGAVEGDGRAEEVAHQAQVWAEEERERMAAAARTHEQAIERMAGRQPGYAATIQNASRTVGRLAGRVRSIEPREIVGRAKGYIQQHPNAVFGALAAGFVVGRLMRRKAS